MTNDMTQDKWHERFREKFQEIDQMVLDYNLWGAGSDQPNTLIPFTQMLIMDLSGKMLCKSCSVFLAYTEAFMQDEAATKMARDVVKDQLEFITRKIYTASRYAVAAAGSGSLRDRCENLKSALEELKHQNPDA